MTFLQHLVLIVAMATAIVSAVMAAPAASAQEKVAELATEDDEFVNKRDYDDDDDDLANNEYYDVNDRIQLDVQVDRRKRAQSGCTQVWTKTELDKVLLRNGVPAPSGGGSLEECQAACVNHGRCTSVYYLSDKTPPAERCVLHGPWSTPLNTGFFLPFIQPKKMGIRHFKLAVDCSAVPEAGQGIKVEAEDTKVAQAAEAKPSKDAKMAEAAEAAGDAEDAEGTEDEVPPWIKSDEKEESESSGGNSRTIVIVVVVIVLVAAVGVTGYAYQQKILCFEPPSDGGDDEEATGESPLLKETTSASKVSPSRTTSATTVKKTRPSGTTISRSTSYTGDW